MSAPPTRRVLLCDAMGTLVRLTAPAPRLVRAAAERLGVAITAHDAERALSAEIAYYRAHMLEGRDPAGVADLRRRCAATLVAALPPLAGVDLAIVTELLLDALHFTAYADAAPALGDARARGERVIVVSNWDASLPAVLSSVGLGGLVDGVLTSAQAGVAKPDPRIFARAIAIAGATPAGARHVGDSLAQDVAGARAAGVAPVWLNRGGAPVPDGVRAITSLAQLGAGDGP